MTRVSVHTILNTSRGMAPMLLSTPSSWKRSSTVMSTVLTTPTIAMTMAMAAMEKTRTLALATRLTMVFFTWASETTCTSGRL